MGTTKLSRHIDGQLFLSDFLKECKQANVNPCSKERLENSNMYHRNSFIIALRRSGHLCCTVLPHAKARAQITTSFSDLFRF